MTTIHPGLRPRLCPPWPGRGEERKRLTTRLVRRAAPSMVLIGIAAALGCSPAPYLPGRATTASFTETFVPAREIRLEENRSVINVWPVVEAEGPSGFLVADPSEAQLRLYTGDGDLLRAFGRSGKGPGEFDRLVRALRLRSGLIAALDMDGRLTLLDSAATRVVEVSTLPILPVYDARVLDDSTLVVSGRYTGAPQSLIHLWSMTRRHVIRSVGELRPPRPELEAAYLTAGGAVLTVVADTVFFAHTVSDTLFRYVASDDRLDRIPMTIPGFRTLRAPSPIGNDASEFQDWLESFSTISGLASGHSLTLQFMDVVGHDRRWTTVVLSTDGRMERVVPDSPMLLAAAQDGLLFTAPGSFEPNQWVLARLR